MSPHRLASLVRWPSLLLALATTSCGSGEAPPSPSAATPPAVAPAPAAPATGALLDADGTLSGRAMRHAVEVRAGDRVRVTLTSSAFDPVLTVALPSGEQLTNDDFQGDRARSELEVIVPSAGTLKIGVSSYERDASGAYHVHVERTAVGASFDAPVASLSSSHHQPFDLSAIIGLASAGLHSAAAAVGAGTNGVTTPSPAPGSSASAATATATRVRVGDRIQGNLSASDSTLPSGERADVYELTVTEPTSLVVQMDSRNLDAFLIVTTPSGEHLQNDDYGGSRNAQINLDATPGTYVVVATSYRPGETGSYELKLLSNRADVSATPPIAASPSAERVERGVLQAGDRQLSSGEFFDEFALPLSVGDSAHVEARSSAFDTYLIVQSPSRDQQDNDDQSPGNRDAALDFVAREAGSYRVLVTSYAPGETGAYELTMRGGASVAPPAGGAAPGATPTPPTQPPAVAASPSGATQTQRGTLAAGDRQLQSGEFYDQYAMTFPPGQPVAIRIESTAFDPYLILRSPSGRQQDNDDYQPGRLTAGVDLPAAEAGSYDVLVTSYRPGETGAYTLTATASGGAPGQPGQPGQPGRPNQPGGPAASPGAGATRVWTVSVGISDYPGSGNDLPECANDARKIVEALHNQGLTTPEREILLTDAQATRANIRQALERVAREIQPSDVFVFFYSGHGGQSSTRSNDARELDGLDEYLYVYDGQFLDDDMGRLIDAIRSRTTLFSVDACFSGGFAKDVVTRPGIIGMFSSEEDVTSAVATRFQAGGYLSHFLRMGIQGEADNDPRDGAMTVGELTHYVWLQYASQARDVRMQEGYQQLVVDRGAMRNAEVLWTRGR